MRLVALCLCACLVAIAFIPTPGRRETAQPILLPLPVPDDGPAHEALAEVNAVRARRNLEPFLYDEGLTQGAKAVAAYRAEHRIKGHTRDDFSFLPAGVKADAAGCAAWPPADGWGSCEMYARQYRYAGAAWALGADGLRYMSLFVRR